MLLNDSIANEIHFNECCMHKHETGSVCNTGTASVKYTIKHQIPCIVPVNTHILVSW